MGCSSSTPKAPDEIMPDPGAVDPCVFLINSVGMMSDDHIVYKGEEPANENRWLFINRLGKDKSGNTVVYLENFNRGGNPQNPKEGEVLWRTRFESKAKFYTYNRERLPEDEGYFIAADKRWPTWGFRTARGSKARDRTLKWTVSTTAEIFAGTRGAIYGDGPRELSLNKVNGTIGMNVNGTTVSTVNPGGCADQAGVKLGDCILSIGGTKVSTQEELIQLVKNIPDDSSVKLEVERKTKFMLRADAVGTSVAIYHWERNKDHPGQGHYEYREERFVERIGLTLLRDGATVAQWKIPGDMPEMTTLNVTVPETIGDTTGDQQQTFTAKCEGQSFLVPVPAGAQAGTQITVQVPLVRDGDHNQDTPFFNMKLKGSSKLVISTVANQDPTLALLVAYICAQEYRPDEIKKDCPNFPCDPDGRRGTTIFDTKPANEVVLNRPPDDPFTVGATI